MKLTPNDERVLAVLTDEPLSVAEVALSTKMLPKSARGTLNRLVRAGLAKAWKSSGRGGPRSYTKAQP